MSFTIPDKGEGVSDNQSVLWEEHIRTLVQATEGTEGVVSGLAVTASGGLGVAVAAGVARFGGIDYSIAAINTSVTPDATNPRFVAIEVLAGGGSPYAVMFQDTPATPPKVATKTAGIITVALIYVPAGATSIAAANIIDTRAFLDTKPLSYRNKIINGKMEIAQRGTSFAAPSQGAYLLDRFRDIYTHAGAVTFTQSTDVPADGEFQNSLTATVTTADASIATGDYQAVEQTIEGYNIRDLAGKLFTISFWVRSSKTGIHCVALRNSGLDRSYVAEYTVNTANTWEKKVLNISAFSLVSGTWNTTNGIGLGVSWCLAVGTTFQTTKDAWNTGSFLGTANQVNCLDTVGNIFAITGVQLEVGGVATTFEHRSYATEVALCQRYYEKSYSTGVAPGTATLVGTHQSVASTAYILSCGNVRFMVNKRIDPSIGIYSSQDGGAGVAAEYNTGGVFVSNRATTVLSGQTAFNIQINGTATVGNNIRFGWIAVAEL